MNVKPITPDEAKASRLHIFPSAVIEAFNELITEELKLGRSVVRQDEVVARIQAKLNRDGINYTTQQIYDKGYLDVEDVYRAAGWKVKYDKPGYDETYVASFIFTRK